MRSSDDEPGRGGTVPVRRELNVHMHRKHPEHKLFGGTWERLVQHEELHTAQHWDHIHDDYELPAEWRLAVKDA